MRCFGTGVRSRGRAECTSWPAPGAPGIPALFSPAPPRPARATRWWTWTAGCLLGYLRPHRRRAEALRCEPSAECPDGHNPTSEVVRVPQGHLARSARSEGLQPVE